MHSFYIDVVLTLSIELGRPDLAVLCGPAIVDVTMAKCLILKLLLVDTIIILVFTQIMTLCFVFTSQKDFMLLYSIHQVLVLHIMLTKNKYKWWDDICEFFKRPFNLFHPCPCLYIYIYISISLYIYVYGLYIAETVFIPNLTLQEYKTSRDFIAVHKIRYSWRVTINQQW